MTQSDRPVLSALVRTVEGAPGYRHQELAAPDLPGPEESELFERVRGGEPIFEFWRNVSCRRPERDRPPDGAARIREWVRFEPKPRFEDPFVDAARPLILLDTFGWPAVYQKHRGVDYVAPNLDTAVWFHGSAAESEWLLVDHECPVAREGLLGVNGRVWDTRGHLLATGGAQLCSIPRP